MGVPKKSYDIEHQLLTELIIINRCKSILINPVFTNRFIVLEHLLNFDSYEQCFSSEIEPLFSYQLPIWPEQYLNNLQSWRYFSQQPCKVEILYRNFEHFYQILTKCYRLFIDSFETNIIDPLAIPFHIITQELNKHHYHKINTNYGA